MMCGVIDRLFHVFDCHGTGARVRTHIPRSAVPRHRRPMCAGRVTLQDFLHGVSILLHGRCALPLALPGGV